MSHCAAQFLETPGANQLVMVDAGVDVDVDVDVDDDDDDDDVDDEHEGKTSRQTTLQTAVLPSGCKRFKHLNMFQHEVSSCATNGTPS